MVSKPAKIFLIILVLGLAYAGQVSAADFNILPASGIYGLKKSLIIDLKINTAGKTINAAQVKLKFNPSILNIQSVTKSESVFQFWLQEPTFSNTNGTLEFIGGTPNGVSGSSLQVLEINFITTGIGASDISFSDASIAADDSSGSNILSNSNGAKFVISSSATLPGTPIATPVPIFRKPIAAPGLPAIPNVNVPLYPNPDNWYNFVSPFTVSWKLPPDVSDISTALNANPNFIPTTSEGLFESKKFPAIAKDGIYYLHVRFQNNNGWGATLHYRIAVDTQTPVPFKLNVKTGLTSNDPTPQLAVITNDALSGISHYEIFVNSSAAIISSTPSYTLSPQPPGEYTLRVRAVDWAGNGIDDKAKIEILPIETPVVDAITQKIVLGSSDLLEARGSALANADVIVTIEDDDKLLVLQTETKTNAQGFWEFRFDKSLHHGDYFVTFKAQDRRGALSLPTSPAKVSVVDKPVISLFGIDLTFARLIIILLLAGIASAGYAWREKITHIKRSRRESVIINRDLKNTFDTVRKDLDQIVGLTQKATSAETGVLELNTLVKKIKTVLEKIEKYASKDIEKLQ